MKNTLAMAGWAFGAFGLLEGLLTSLSASPVTAAVLGTLTPCVVTLISWKTTTTADESSPSRLHRSLVSLGCFASTMIIGLVVGLTIRTHNFLSASPSARVAQWTAAHFSEEQAKMIVLSELNLSPEKKALEREGKDGLASAPSARDSVLFAGHEKAGAIQFAPVIANGSLPEILAAFRSIGGGFARVADHLEVLKAPDQDKVAIAKEIFALAVGTSQ